MSKSFRKQVKDFFFRLGFFCGVFVCLFGCFFEVGGFFCLLFLFVCFLSK